MLVVMITGRLPICMNVIAIQRYTIRLVKGQRQLAILVSVIDLERPITLLGLLIRRLMKVMKY